VQEDEIGRSHIAHEGDENVCKILVGKPEGNGTLGRHRLRTASRPALGPTQPPIQWVPGALSLGVKWLGHEADHPPPYSAEVKE